MKQIELLDIIQVTVTLLCPKTYWFR